MEFYKTGEIMTSPCHNHVNPHDKYIDHIKRGGRVLRVDGMNNTIEIFKAGSFKNFSDLKRYGLNDLLIIEDDTINTSAVMMLLLHKNKTRVFEIEHILDAICRKYDNELQLLIYCEEEGGNKIM